LDAINRLPDKPDMSVIIAVSVGLSQQILTPIPTLNRRQTNEIN
jgi:hypothetical protein